MSFVHHKPGAVAFLCFDNFPQWSEVAVHGKDAFGHNEDARPTPGLASRAVVRQLQNFLQIVDIIMSEDPDLRLAQMRGIDDGSMNEFIDDDDVIFAKKGSDGAESRGVSRREAERRGNLLE